MHSWRVLILPYIEHEELYKEYRFDEPWDGPNNRKLAARMPPQFAFHGEHKDGSTVTNYLAVVGRETVWQGFKGVPGDAVANTSAILIAENKGLGVHWMEPRDFSFADMDFTLHSPRGISSRYVNPAVALVDGRVMSLNKDLEARTLRAMLMIAGGEKVGHDDERGWHILPDGRQRPEKK